MTAPLVGDIFSVGQLLNNTYEVEKLLGRGGTGEVYRARNKITGRLVAIKALNRQFSGNADYIELMKREEEMRAIQHPAVVRYTECSMSDDNHVFLVMDYVEGPPLSDVMTRRGMDPRELLIIGHRVAEGLVATHAQGIIHRDLSPDNIILCDGDPAKATIIDFGIAKDTAVGARTVVGSDFAGKYEYAAPEQLDGHVDQQSDLYALGATLLAAWRGDTPFLGATPGEVVRRKQSVLDTEGVPDKLREIIDALTAPDPADRPATAAALVTQINALIQPKSGGKSDDDAGNKPRRKWPMFALLGLIVLAAASWLIGSRPPALPNVTPYTLTLTVAQNGASTLSGNAPDSDTASDFMNKVAQTFGAAPEGLVTPASGMPSDSWVAEVEQLIGTVSVLQEGQLLVSDVSAAVIGLTADSAAKGNLEAALASFAAAQGWSVTTDLTAGPKTVLAQTLTDTLRDLADCGPLEVEGGINGAFGLTDPIRVTGNLAADGTAAKVKESLLALVGERPMTLATQTLNPELCLIRQTLAAVPTTSVSISLANGETGERNLSGVFTTGQNPVVDVVIPSQYGDASLWVMAVNPDGSVFHVIPNLYNEQSQINQLAPIDAGLHRVRALHSIDAFAADNKKLAIKVTDGDYGKSEIIAILSQTPLFEGRRPTSESVVSTAEALKTILAANPNNAIGVASVIIDARP